MKKISTLALIMIFCLMAHSQSKQQYILNFCTFVNNQNQECIFDNNKFITTPDSTHAKLFMMLRSNQVFDTTNLTFKIYEIDRFGKEVYIDSIIQTVETTWMTSWQPFSFVSPGKYMVKVYRDGDHILASKGFEFFNQ